MIKDVITESIHRQASAGPKTTGCGREYPTIPPPESSVTSWLREDRKAVRSDDAVVSAAARGWFPLIDNQLPRAHSDAQRGQGKG